MTWYLFSITYMDRSFLDPSGAEWIRHWPRAWCFGPFRVFQQSGQDQYFSEEVKRVRSAFVLQPFRMGAGDVFGPSSVECPATRNIRPASFLPSGGWPGTLR